MNDYIAKPVDTRNLWAVLARHVAPEGGGVLLDEERFDHDRVALGPVEAPSSVDGIDLKEALRRVAGDLDFLLDLLRQCVENHGHDAAEIREAVARKDLTEAHMRAHALRGMAGNVSAKGLEKAAEALEAALRHGDDHALDSLTERLEEELKRFRSSVETLESSLPSSPARADPESDVEPLFHKLCGLLASNDMEAQECFSLLKSALPNETMVELDGLESQIRKLRFSDALSTLESFMYRRAG